MPSSGDRSRRRTLDLRSALLGAKLSGFVRNDIGQIGVNGRDLKPAEGRYSANCVGAWLSKIAVAGKTTTFALSIVRTSTQVVRIHA